MYSFVWYLFLFAFQQTQLIVSFYFRPALHAKKEKKTGKELKATAIQL